MYLKCDICYNVSDSYYICKNKNCGYISCKICIVNSITNNIYNFKCFNCNESINNCIFKHILDLTNYNKFVNYAYDKIYHVDDMIVLNYNYNILQGSYAIRNIKKSMINFKKKKF
ncbi:hypothetical protein AHEV_208 [Adoxophyes honmai entomopoxvirus 'L']|uniref:RING-type domain-containing protein n=1 Tax=Adoxophyes honmai entomopoxvirus 'L' TaxID=1293540 RepID=A0A916P120_9POXV|nr:hypothetical protein AHEV_208 [Adoxophyes honmai entomopoxvirus 'L']CCU55529.1 hypothetical protein AHEV_208 [Adoxophyes honmai entomopoxvirus 'L']